MVKESNFKNMFWCLLLVCLVASALLGGVYVLTKEKIAFAEREKLTLAIKQVLPEFDNEPAADTVALAGGVYEVYRATFRGEPAGYAVKAYTSKGFGGRIDLMVGFRADGSIQHIQVLSHAETPGLGANMSGAGFLDQWKGFDLAQKKAAVKKDGGDVDAITAATISSRAFCDAVAQAYEVYKAVSAKTGAKETGEEMESGEGRETQQELE